MIYRKDLIFFLIAAISLLFFSLSCKESNPLDPVLYAYGEPNDTTLALAGTIIIDNPFGATTILGDITEDRIILNRHKLVKAENSAIAESYYDSMIFTLVRNGDSLFISTKAPEETKKVKPYTNVGITMPPAIKPIIKNTRNNVTTYYLTSLCLIENAHGNIILNGHDGSCDVHTTLGNISIETFIPTAGFCRAYSGAGDIVLKIPTYTSATVDVMTNTGEINVTPDLVITDEQNNGNSITGTLKDGAGEIYLRTDVGNISIVGFN